MIDLTHSDSSADEPEFIISIDIGTLNLGFVVCVRDNPTSMRVVHMCNENMVNTAKYESRYNVKYVKDFIASHEHYFDNASSIIIERQNAYSYNMKIIETAFHALLYEKVSLVNASHVKDHFLTKSMPQTSKRTKSQKYRKKKVDAVNFVSSILSNLNSNTVHMRKYSLHISQSMVNHFFNSSKKDDIADAFMMMMYHLDNLT